MTKEFLISENIVRNYYECIKEEFFDDLAECTNTIMPTSNEVAFVIRNRTLSKYNAFVLYCEDLNSKTGMRFYKKYNKRMAMFFNIQNFKNEQRFLELLAHEMIHVWQFINLDEAPHDELFTIVANRLEDFYEFDRNSVASEYREYRNLVPNWLIRMHQNQAKDVQYGGTTIGNLIVMPRMVNKV